MRVRIRTEDGGLLEALYVLNVEPGEDVMSGIESRTWTVDALFCPTGLSQVDATHIQ